MAMLSIRKAFNRTSLELKRSTRARLAAWTDRNLLIEPVWN